MARREKQMNTYSKRRRTFLSLLLSVAMVFTYAAAAVGGNAENVYADTTLITIDPECLVDGALQISLDEDYDAQTDNGFFTYTAKANLSPFDKYVEFKVVGEDGFELQQIADEPIEADQSYTVAIIPPEGLTAGTHELTLQVYEDASGSGVFDYMSGPTTSVGLVVTVGSDDEPSDESPITASLELVGDNYRYISEGNIEEKDAFTYNLTVCTSSEEFVGKPVSQYVDIQVGGDYSSKFTVTGLEDAKIGNVNEVVEVPVRIMPDRDLKEGYYSASVYLYTDSLGTDDFTGGQIGDVSVDVTERQDYEFEINDGKALDFGNLHEGFTEEDANACKLPIVIHNKGKETVDIKPTDFGLFDDNSIDGREVTEVALVFDKGTDPITLEPGERCQIASIVPVPGAKAGRYWLGVNGCCGPYNAAQHVYLNVAKEGAHLERREPNGVDFGFELVGLPDLDEFDCYKDAYITNTGDTSLKICEVRAPEEGPFATSDVPEYKDGVLAPGDYVNITLGLVPDKATKLGDYDTHYTVIAKPVDEDGNLIDDAEALELKIPVHLTITDESYKLTFDFQGHADNVVFDVPKGGKKIREYASKAQDQRFEAWEPVDDGCVLKGFNLRPLGEYSNWESYDTDRDEYWETEVTGDMTVYAMWHPIIDTPIELEVPPCLCGQPALVDSITAKAGGENIEASLQWYTADEMTEEDAVVDAENNYQAYLYVSPRAKFPCVLTRDAVEEAGVMVNGELIHPNIDERDTLVITYPVTAQHDIEKLEAADATCAKDGNIECWTCKGCGKYFSDKEGTEELDAANVIKPKLDKHTLTEVDKVDATCAKEGTEAYWKCSVCEKMFSDAEGTKEIDAPVAIPVTEHTEETIPAVAPTCTDPGKTEGKKCSVCGEILKEQDVVDATGHDLTKTEKVDATCAKEGTEAYWKCSVCEKMFLDAEGTKEIEEPVAIPKTDKHSWNEGEITTPPTCTEAGVKTFTCSVCGETKTESVAPEHSLAKTEKVDATCAKEGTEAYWKCSVCEKMFSDAKGTKEIEAPVAIPKTDKHSWGEWKTTKEATTSAAGEKVRECSVCHKTEKQVIPKKEETKYSNGWHKIGGEWYYYKNNAKVTNGWAKDSKGWCYLDKTGKMVRNGWVKDSKGYCWLNSSGYWVTGTKWIKCNGDWYYITNGYRDANKWKKDSKGWCYLGKDGKMVTNGWAKDSKGWCWMGSNGYWTSNKWVKDKGEWYYIKSNHYMAANEWAKDSKGWMYMAGNGKITKSKWIKSGGAWYYLKDNGYMATGTLKIGSKTYRFASSGKWID